MFHHQRKQSYLLLLLFLKHLVTVNSSLRNLHQQVKLYSNIRGRYFYKVSEIRRMLEERLIRSNKENIDNLITNHQLYAKERGNLRKNK